MTTETLECQVEDKQGHEEIEKKSVKSYIDLASYKMLISQVISFGGNWIVFEGALH